MQAQGYGKPYPYMQRIAVMDAVPTAVTLCEPEVFRP